VGFYPTIPFPWIFPEKCRLCETWILEKHLKTLEMITIKPGA
jgi:hypothetical protein